MTDPDSETLGDAPLIDASAEVRDTVFGRYNEVGPRTRLAECSFGDYAYVVNDSNLIYTDVGKFASIASHVRVNPGNHPLPRAALSHFTYRASAYGLGEDEAEFFAWRRSFRCRLGADCWLGHGAIVLPGVSVGIGAAVGAGAVVTKDVPDFAVVAGNPARVLRYRFAEEIRAALLRISWWDWDHDRLRDELPGFRALSIEAFCARHDPG